jgi:putative transcriptional regulator
MVKHHPDSRLLNEYAAGALPLAQSLCISLHLNYCSQCSRNHKRLQQVGSAMFDRLQPQAVGETVLEAVLSRLDEEVPLTFPRSVDSESAPEESGKNDYPALIRRLMDRDYDELEWDRVTPSLRVSRLRTGDREHEFALYHIRAGGRIPHHTHRGVELTQVLEGSFADESGFYSEGDFLMRDAEDEHTPTASRDGDCICIGVLDAPIRFTEWKYRPLNPFLTLNAH